MSVQANDKLSGLLHKFRFVDITLAEFQDLRTRMDTISDVELKHLLEAEWEEFEDHTPLPEEKMKTLYERLHIRSEEVKPRFTLKRYWMQVAASLLLLIAGSLTVLTFMQQNEINALAEQNVVIRSGDYGKSLVTLPDGTIVHLNAKSSLTYSQDFGRNDRKVALSGEGFFEVKKDTEKKFTVGTGYMDITVLGTKFNVYAYETKDIVEMSLVEGSVDVTTSRPPYQSIRVKPNEKVVYNKRTGNLLHERTSNKMETAWINKELVWAPLNEEWYPDRSIYPRFVKEIYDLTKALDPSRPINTVSGGTHVVTDIWSVHTYEQEPEKLKTILYSDGKFFQTPNNTQGVPKLNSGFNEISETAKYDFPLYAGGIPYILDEFDGIKWVMPEHRTSDMDAWGYGDAPKSEDEFFIRLKGQVDTILSLSKYVWGYCYTQLTDVEQEQNGLYKYDRSPKFEVSKLHEIFSKAPSNYLKE